MTKYAELKPAQFVAVCKLFLGKAKTHQSAILQNVSLHQSQFAKVDNDLPQHILSYKHPKPYNTSSLHHLRTINSIRRTKCRSASTSPARHLFSRRGESLGATLHFSLSPNACGGVAHQVLRKRSSGYNSYGGRRMGPRLLTQHP
jgi:hypothetical protein